MHGSFHPCASEPKVPTILRYLISVRYKKNDDLPSVEQQAEAFSAESRWKKLAHFVRIFIRDGPICQPINPFAPENSLEEVIDNRVIASAGAPQNQNRAIHESESALVAVGKRYIPQADQSFDRPLERNKLNMVFFCRDRFSTSDLCQLDTIALRPQNQKPQDEYAPQILDPSDCRRDSDFSVFHPLLQRRANRTVHPSHTAMAFPIREPPHAESGAFWNSKDGARHRIRHF